MYLSALYSSMRPARSLFLSALFFSLTAALLLPGLSGCAGKQESRIDRVLPQVTTMNQARLFFGSPGRSEPQPDGTIRNEWLLDARYEVQGQYVTERSPWITHDSDGYPVEVDREVWRRGHTEHKQCRLVIISDANGKVLRTSREGDSCDDLFIQPERQDGPPSLQ